MADVTITSDQLGSSWTIRNAAPDPLTGELDEYNAAIAVGAQIGIWYGDRIKALSAEVLPDTQKLDLLRNVIGEMKGWSAAEWNSGIAADNTLEAALAPYTEIARRGNLLVSAGIDMAQYTKLSFYTLAYKNDSPFYTSTYPAQTINQPWPRDATGAPTNTLLDTTGLANGNLYITSDGYPFVYDNFRTTAAAPMNVYTAYNYGPLLLYPTEAQVTALKRAVQDEAEKLTQITQGKQAFLQDLIASMSKYLNFATNVMQRYERNRLDIIGRF